MQEQVDTTGIFASASPVGRAWRAARFSHAKGGILTPLSDTIYLDREQAREAAARILSQEAHSHESQLSSFKASAAFVICMIGLAAFCFAAVLFPEYMFAGAIVTLSLVAVAFGFACALCRQRMARMLSQSAETARMLLLGADPMQEEFHQDKACGSRKKCNF